jgi:hypothetical protein
VLLITSYLLSAFVDKKWIADAQVALFTLAGLIAIRNASLRLRTARIVAPAGFIVSLLVIIIANHHGGNTGRGVAAVWSGLLLLLMVITIVRQILSAPEVTLQSIYGAICAYLIIGLMFSAFYGAMYYLHDRTFFANDQMGDAANFQYFSFTTLTTLGYGDFTAKLNGGRAVAMLEAMTGQIFLATLVAKLVGSFRPAAAAARNAADRPASGDS